MASVYEKLKENFNPEHSLEEEVTIQLYINEVPISYIKIKEESFDFLDGEDSNAEYGLKVDEIKDLECLVEGEKTGMEAFMDGSLKINGDVMRLSMILQDVFNIQ